MSDLLAPRPPDYDDEESRTRAIWGLVALAIIAVLIVVVLLLIGGGKHHGAQTPTGLSQLPTAVPTSRAQPSGPAASGSAVSSPATSSAATTTSPAPTSTANPCPTPGACAVPGDAGQLVAAVNAFRTSHGQPAASGAVSPQAQQCALSQGNGPSCAPSFAWEPVPTQDGAKVVDLIAGRGGDWLLDPTMTSFSIGWAYAPGTGYECAILKVSS